MRRAWLPLLALTIQLFASRGWCAGPPGQAVITVEAGAHERVDAPVSVVLPPGLVKMIKDAPAPGVVETTDGKLVALPAQLQTIADPPGARLWFILAGKTAAGAKRTFELGLGEIKGSKRVALERTDALTDIAFDGQTVLRYNHIAVKPPAGVDDVFLRSGYIHPIHTPSGKLMTEDFPADHFHHKGLWQAWVNTEFEGRHVDFWNLKDKTGAVKFAAYGDKTVGPVYAAFQTKHDHLDVTQNPPKTVLNESWDVRVFNVGGKAGGYYLFDLTSTQRCASNSALHLKEYRYGGVGYRGPKDWGKKDYTILTSEGKTYADAHATRARWCIHSGKVAGGDASVVLMSHPDNPVHPEPMRTSGGFGPFFNWAPVQAGDFTIEPGKDYVFRYRFMIADGNVDKDAAERAWRAFGDPPKVTLTMKSLE